MNRSATLAAVLLLAACQKPAATSNETAVADAADTTASAPEAKDLLAGTSWTFTDAKAGEIIATFGTDGRYYDINKGKTIESGTFATDQGQVCEDVDGTPANDQVCWTVPATLPPVGGSIDTTSNKGQTVTITRVDFKGNAPATGKS